MFGLNGNGPWWAKIAMTIGPLGTMAFLLVWWLTQTLAGDLAAHARASDEGIRTLIRISTAICLNEAESDREKINRCLLLERLPTR